MENQRLCRELFIVAYAVPLRGRQKALRGNALDQLQHVLRAFGVGALFILIAKLGVDGIDVDHAQRREMREGFRRHTARAALKKNIIHHTDPSSFITTCFSRR